MDCWVIGLIIDEEVFAVMLAISVVASTVGIAVVLRPETVEPFTAIGLLNEDCRIGDYPTAASNNSFLNLCIFVLNHMGKPVYYRVIYKIGDRETIPTNTTPSLREPVLTWMGVLGDKQNTTKPIEVPVYTLEPLPSTVALIFELWLYDTELAQWIYTGRWVHLYMNITPLLP
ncbi:MAG: DUF1616 domain-containing protein [Desulfurococcaceae archaeon]